MPKMNVAFSLDAEELSRFDNWRSSLHPPLARGPALVRLFEFMVEDGSMLGSPRLRRTEIVEVGTSRAAQPDVDGGYVPTSVNLEENASQSEVSVQVDDLRKQMKVEAAKMALNMLEKKKGVVPVEIVGDEVVKKTTLGDWDEYDQSGGDK